MKTQNDVLTNNLKNFALQYVKCYQDKYGHLPLVEHDEQWPSECLQGKNDKQTNFWRPIEFDQSLSFNNVESALQLKLHDDIKCFFTTLFGDSIHGQCAEGALSLLLPWSPQDFERLQENIIGHILMKQKLKQPVTVFFAVTDDEDCILSIDNDSGEVWVERVGCLAHKKLSNNVATFIESLTPLAP